MIKWQVGDITITQMLELESSDGSVPVLPDATPEALAEIDWMKPDYVTPEGNLRLNIQMLIIEHPDRKLVVDTCVGNDKTLDLADWGNRQSPFLERLIEAGHDPDSVDGVICTHLHPDHVGWNTRKQGDTWVPTFPNARYYFVENEFHHWKDQEDFFVESFTESIAPVFDAGLVDLIDPDFQICDGISMASTPGHTPGHASVQLNSQGLDAFITGDMIHHPCQIAKPHWCSAFDSDPARALETRKRVLEQFADSATLFIGTHFAGQVGGKLIRDGEAYRLV